MAEKRKPIQPELGLQLDPGSGLEPAAAERSSEPVHGRDLKRRERRAPKARAALPVERIVSGGQTGADRAALDFARAHGIPHGGWCPRGRLSEDGAVENHYELRETPEADYSQRTEWNVRDADGTVIFSLASKLSSGSRLTRKLATRLGKPWLHLSASAEGESAAERLREFVERHGIRVLNVAGPRASHEPGVARFVIETLEQLFKVAKLPGRRWDSYSG